MHQRHNKALDTLGSRIHRGNGNFWLLPCHQHDCVAVVAAGFFSASSPTQQVSTQGYCPGCPALAMHIRFFCLPACLCVLLLRYCSCIFNIWSLRFGTGSAQSNKTALSSRNIMPIYFLDFYLWPCAKDTLLHPDLLHNPVTFLSL